MTPEEHAELRKWRAHAEELAREVARWRELHEMTLDTHAKQKALDTEEKIRLLERIRNA